MRLQAVTSQAPLATASLKQLAASAASPRTELSPSGTTANRTHFSGAASASRLPLLYLAPNAISSFWNDTAGVYLPKVPTWRSRIQAFKDTFLEFVEDGAFYFSIPVAGPILARSYEQMSGLSRFVAEQASDPAVAAKAREKTIQWLGTPFHVVEKEIPKVIKGAAQKEVLERIAANKAGALVGAVAFASGFEYLIPHVNNLLTAKFFNATNFTAVAGLEKSRSEVKDGEVDIIRRAKRRLGEVAAIAGTLVAGSATLPQLLKGRSGAVKNLLRFVDFAANPKAGVFYDLSKPLLAIVIGHGVASYLDASQSSLERKETALRLGFVVPYLLAGGEITKNALGWLFQNQTINNNGKRYVIGDAKKAPSLLRWLFQHDKTTGSLNVNFLQPKHQLKDALTKPGQFLNFDALNSEVAVKKAVDTLGKKSLTLSDDAQMAVLKKFNSIGATSFLLKTLGMGVSLNLAAYALTRYRFNKQQHTTASGSKPKQNETLIKTPKKPWPAPESNSAALGSALETVSLPTGRAYLASDTTPGSLPYISTPSPVYTAPRQVSPAAATNPFLAATLPTAFASATTTNLAFTGI